VAASGLLSVSGSCQGRRLVQESPLPPLAETRMEATGPEYPAPVRAGMTRTGCFGSCPVFSVRIFADGQVRWHGERHVERLGRFVAQASPEWLASLWQAADTAGFFFLEPVYPAKGAPRVPDLPLTILFLDDGQRRHEVVDNADAPLRLQRLERYVMEKLEELEWKAVKEP
jgi:hypothetical protein